jgi:hypothetical protein
MSYRFGDRVRLGATRGGIVLPVDGRLRVVTPDGRLHWLDHWVTDEGPDGRIWPNTWDLCDVCGNPTYQMPTVSCAAGFGCRNCNEEVRPLTYGIHLDPLAVRRYEVEVFRRLPEWAQTFLRVQADIARSAHAEVMERR